MGEIKAGVTKWLSRCDVIAQFHILALKCDGSLTEWLAH